MATLTLTTTTIMRGSLVKSPDLTTARETIDIIKTTGLTNGTGSNQANEFFSDQRTLAATSENLDIQDASLSNAFADGIAFSAIKHLVVLNNSTTSTEILTVSGDGLLNVLGGTTPTIKVGPSGGFHWWSPIDGAAVVADSADVITANSGSDTITYKLVIVGLT